MTQRNAMREKRTRVGQAFSLLDTHVDTTLVHMTIEDRWMVHNRSRRTPQENWDARPNSYAVFRSYPGK